MRWLDGDSEMKFFSKEREVRYDEEGKYREFNLYNVRTGIIFCRLRIYDDRTEIRTLDFFNEIKDELYTLIMRDIASEEEYSYDKWILPLFRQKKLEEILK
jgi:hypothetical protein